MAKRQHKTQHYSENKTLKTCWHIFRTTLYIIIKVLTSFGQIFQQIFRENAVTSGKQNLKTLAI